MENKLSFNYYKEEMKILDEKQIINNTFITKNPKISMKINMKKKSSRKIAYVGTSLWTVKFI